MEQSWPLQALHYIQIDDVDMILAVQRLEYRLVRCEMRELDQRTDGIIRLQSIEDPLRLSYR